MSQLYAYLRSEYRGFILIEKLGYISKCHIIHDQLYTVVELALKTETTKYLAFIQIQENRLRVSDQTDQIILLRILQNAGQCVISRTHERTFKLTVGSSLCTDKQGTSKIGSPSYCTSIHRIQSGHKQKQQSKLLTARDLCVDWF